MPPPRLNVVLPVMVEPEIVTGAPITYRKRPPPLPAVAVLPEMVVLVIVTGLLAF